ncbi:integrator complex subunit 12-like protein [Leptotrombidium deliense]|uniref:Integrator complex subunit 12 n=1 Tax=Leptotrombidium deliense TaxID=299467 RepID=A0A443SPJ4_9ACAR|nr:integrator complex subunit 12-like protein [Leptotrombidium deliense]
MSNEFDANFFAALKLLHAKSRSSADQLKALLDEAISAKQVNAATRPSVLCKPIKQEPVEIESKKIRLISPPATVPSTPSPDLTIKVTKPSLPPVEDIKQEIKEEDSEATDIEEETTESERSQDFALEGLACVVCKHIDTQPNNQTVECQECHNLYHQDCHKPPITDKDVSDPRLVWYCSKCTKSMKKMSNKSKNNNKSPNGGTTTSAQFASNERLGREQAYQLMKAKETAAALASPPSVQIQPFKRVEPKSTAGSNTVSAAAKPAVGLAGFAANLNRTSSNSLSTVTSSVVSSSSSSTTQPISMTSPSEVIHKRLQQMKKNAVSKQEKKRFKITK